jgi:hypothetical protein
MRAIVKVFNDSGRAALAWHYKEEKEFRNKVGRIPKMFRTKQVNKFLKTISVLDNDSLTISNFSADTEEDLKFFEERVKEAMIANGAEYEDFSVTFEVE